MKLLLFVKIQNVGSLQAFCIQLVFLVIFCFQESMVNKPKPEKSPLLSQSAEGRPATPEPSPVENSSESTSTQPEQSLGVTSNK